VSLFLSEKVQNTDGSFILKNNGVACPDIEKTGIITYYDDNEKISSIKEIHINSSSEFKENVRPILYIT